MINKNKLFLYFYFHINSYFNVSNYDSNLLGGYNARELTLHNYESKLLILNIKNKYPFSFGKNNHDNEVKIFSKTPTIYFYPFKKHMIE